MRGKAGVVVWAIAVVGCREQNPYFVEPPLATSSGAGDSESGTGTSMPGPTTGSTTVITGATDSEGPTSDTLDTDPTMGSTATTDSLCEVGEVVCEGNTKRVCDGSGGFTSEEDCAAMCVAALGCALCVPQSFGCEGEAALVCADDGMAWQEVASCDPLQGLSCDANSGKCLGACTDAALGLRQVGCDFHGTSLASLHPQQWTGNFGVIAVNTSVEPAVVTVTRGGMVLKEVMVAPLNAETIELSYVPEVSQSGLGSGTSSVLVAQATFRVRSTQPLVVYQFETLEPMGTSDASLLLPVHTWGTDHVVASWPFAVGNMQEPLAGFYAVVASEDGTQVVVTPPPDGGPVAMGAGIDGGGAGVVTLDAGGVLEVFSANGGDVSGTRVATDKPVSVFGGHRCAVVSDTSTCDHLEESMPPVAALGKEYFVTPPHSAFYYPEYQRVRVVATEADTNIMFEPQQDAADNLVEPGAWLDFSPGQDNVRITADKKILVAQYMSGGDEFSDPSMAVAVPTAQYRDVYLVSASTLHDSRWLSVVAPDGAALAIDGMPIEDLISIAGTGYSTVSVALPETDAGSNVLSGDAPFGAMVYGYAPVTSYWYAGGMDLATLPP